MPIFLFYLGPFFGSTRAASILPSRPPNLAAVARRACQGWPRLRGHPKGLALIGPSTAASLIGSGLEALATSLGNSNRWLLVKFTPLVTSPGSSASRCCTDVSWRYVVDRDANPPLHRAPPSRPAHSASGTAARCAPIGQTPAPRRFAGRSPTPPGTPSHRPRRPHPRRDSDAPAVRRRRSPADPLRSASCSAH